MHEFRSQGARNARSDTENALISRQKRNISPLQLVATRRFAKTRSALLRSAVSERAFLAPPQIKSCTKPLPSALNPPPKPLLYADFLLLVVFLLSETHELLEDAENGLWEYPERGIFDMWKAEQNTGDPRNSPYVLGA